MRARAGIALLALFACACNEAFADRIRMRSIRGRDTVLSVPDTESPVDGSAIVFTVTADTITLNWGDATDNVGVDHYEVRMMAASQTSPANCNTGSTVTGCSDPTVSNCTATGLTQMTSYAFIVCAADLAGNHSTGLTGWEQPFVDAYAIHFGDDSGTPVNNEIISVADNAIFECDSNDDLTYVITYNVDTCVDGGTCDDQVLSKGPNTEVTYSYLIEFAAGGYRPRVANGALATWGQTNVIRSDATAGVGLLDVWQKAGVTVDLGGADNDAKMDIFVRQCNTDSPPVCATLATDMTAGLGACGSAPCFLGTQPSSFGDDATAFLTGGFAVTGNYNLLGYVSESAGFCNGKVTAAQLNDCIFDGTTGKFLNLRTLSKRSSGGTDCDDIFTDFRWWYRYGDGEAACTSDNVVLTNWANPGTGNLADTNMECSDIVAHNL